MKHGRRSGLRKLPLTVVLSLLLLGVCVSYLVCHSLGIDMSSIHVGIGVICCWGLMMTVATLAGMQKLWEGIVVCGNLGWLARMPWTHDKPLPFGAPFMGKRDVVQLVVISFAALLMCVGLPGQESLEGTPLEFYSEYFSVFVFVLPLVTYLACCVLAMFSFLCDIKQRSSLGYLGGIAYALPLMFYPFGDVVFACAILVAIYVYCHFGVKHYMRGFPWNSAYWKEDHSQVMREEKQRIVHVPRSSVRYLNPKVDVKGVSFWLAVRLSVVLLWWAHVGFWMAGERMQGAFVLGAACVLAAGRTLVYMCLGATPPISYKGRICTGRWILPKYDKLFIAPVCVVLVGAFGPAILESMMFPEWLSVRIVFFVVGMLVLALPPSIRSWALTGAYSVVMHSRSQRGKRRDS